MTSNAVTISINALFKDTQTLSTKAIFTIAFFYAAPLRTKL